MSIREKIKNANDIEKEVITIDVWDCDIEVRTMTAKQRANILNKVMTEDGKIEHDNFHAMMIIYSCYDPETGEKVFDDKDKDWLLEKSAGPIELLVSKIMKHSGLSKDALVEAEKN